MKEMYLLLPLLGFASGFLVDVRSSNHNALSNPSMPSAPRHLASVADLRKLSHRQHRFDARIQFPSRRSTTSSSALSMSASVILEQTLETIRAFSKSNLGSSSTKGFLNKLTKQAIGTPPVAYFFALMAAGFGIPVSEDALCLFAGAIWNELKDKGTRLPIILALYGGVVASDYVTFFIGRLMRTSLLAPMASRLGLQKNRSENNDGAIVNGEKEDNSESKMVKFQDFLRRTGDWAGFIIRFSLGTRGPLMLLTGFSNQVPFWKFALGAAAGGAISLPLQLFAGYLIGRNNPGAVVGVVAAISTFVLGCAMVVGSLSLVTLILSQLQLWRQQKRTGASSKVSSHSVPASSPLPESVPIL